MQLANFCPLVSNGREGDMSVTSVLPSREEKKEKYATGILCVGVGLLHCPLRWREATHAGLDGGIDEPLLQHVAGVQVDGEEA
jgi:hypothetical protein